MQAEAKEWIFKSEPSNTANESTLVMTANTIPLIGLKSSEKKIFLKIANSISFVKKAPKRKMWHVYINGSDADESGMFFFYFR